MNKNAVKRINNAFWTVLGDYNKLPSFYQIIDNEDFLFYGILNAGLANLKKDSIIDYKNSLQKSSNNMFNKMVLKLCLYEYGLSQVREDKPAIPYIVDEYFKSRLESKNVHILEQEYCKENLGLEYDHDFSMIIESVKKCALFKDASELLNYIKEITDVYKVNFDFQKLLNVDLNYMGYDEKFENDILDLAMNENIFSAEFTFNTDQDKFSSEYKEEEKKKIRDENIVYNQDQRDIKKKFGDMIIVNDRIAELEKKYCKGIHEGCKIYITDGEFEGVEGENHIEELSKQVDLNKAVFERDKAMIDVQINKIVTELKEYFNSREDFFKKNRGRLDAKLAYKGMYLNNPNIFKTRSIDVKKPFVCEILLDGSGSLDNKQTNVSEIAYIISEAFNRVGVRTKVSAFSNYVEYIIFRQYKSFNSSDNEMIKNYYATGMNRDSLALNIVKDDLLNFEEKKLVIYLNDGYPNDINIVNQFGGFSRKDYDGKVAINDIKSTVLDFKKQGVHLLSIYLGRDKRIKDASEMYGDNLIYLHRVEELGYKLTKFISKNM
ncbi:MAG: hypothetical protein CSB16_02445 [Clostridiales bacterium]|nr:MAG: hypothetical protein CSB16_02445 [Clostridiales bacterium]